MSNIKIMVACHKKCGVPVDPMYLPIFVGSKGKDDIGFTRDDTGDEISSLNPLYCELTGLYWCWKNLECDYLGLVHYRRYFTLRNRSYQKKHAPLASVLTSAEAKKLLEEYDVILPKKRHYYIETIYSHYDHTFDGNQFDITQQVLDEMEPEYSQYFSRLMKQRSSYLFNMFIMSKKRANEYCTWLFPLLSEIEKRYDISGLSDFEKRYIGRVSERLFNVWLMYQTENGKLEEKRIKEIPYTYLGNVNWPKKISGFLQAKIFHKKYKQSF